MLFSNFGIQVHGSLSTRAQSVHSLLEPRIGPDPKRRFILSDSVRQLARQLRQGVSQVEMRLGEIGIDPQCRFELGDRFRQPPPGIH
jgi:hypothetical protein